MALITLLTYQYSETNVMHLLLSWLRINGLYVFRALLEHPQEALQIRHLVYCVRVMSVGCTSSAPILVQPTDITRYIQNTSIYKNHCIFWNILFNILFNIWFNILSNILFNNLFNILSTILFNILFNTLSKPFNIIKFYWQIFYSLDKLLNKIFQKIQ
jgi:hypothetical protein